MKKLNFDFLNSQSKFYWYVSIIFYSIIFIIPLVCPFVFKTEEDRFMFWTKWSLNTFHVNNIWSQVLLFISMANYIWIIIAFKNFKQLIINFEKEIIFQKETEKLLQKLGDHLSYCAGIFSALEITLAFLDKNYNFSKFIIYGFIILIGQFFFALTKLFKKTRKIKKENELTV